MIHGQDGPSCPYMVNTFKNFLLLNHWADWYVTIRLFGKIILEYFSLELLGLNALLIISLAL